MDGKKGISFLLNKLISCMCIFVHVCVEVSVKMMKKTLFLHLIKMMKEGEMKNFSLSGFHITHTYFYTCVCGVRVKFGPMKMSPQSVGKCSSSIFLTRTYIIFCLLLNSPESFRKCFSQSFSHACDDEHIFFSLKQCTARAIIIIPSIPSFVREKSH